MRGSKKIKEQSLALVVKEESPLYRHELPIKHQRACNYGPSHINCMTPKEWLKSQLGVWQFFYEARDVRNKNIHPATFPIALAKKVIELFTHKGELVLDPFVGSGTTLVAAQDTDRNAVGFDLQQKYIDLCKSRLIQTTMFSNSKETILPRETYRYQSYFPKLKLIGHD